MLIIVAGEQSRLSLVRSSAKHHQLDAGLYVKDILDSLLVGETDYSKLVPDAWKCEHPRIHCENSRSRSSSCSKFAAFEQIQA